MSKENNNFEDPEPETPQDAAEEKRWNAIVKAFGEGKFDLAEDFGVEFSEEKSEERERKAKRMVDYEKM